MGTIAEKLLYTSNSVDDIQKAINEKGVEVQDNVPLGEYGEKIRSIPVGLGGSICIWEDIGQDFYGITNDDYVFEPMVTAFIKEELNSYGTMKSFLFNNNIEFINSSEEVDIIPTTSI